MEERKKPWDIAWAISSYKQWLIYPICTFQEKECDIDVNNEHSHVSFLERKGSYVDFWSRKENRIITLKTSFTKKYQRTLLMMLWQFETCFHLFSDSIQTYLILMRKSSALLCITNCVTFINNKIIHIHTLVLTTTHKCSTVDLVINNISPIDGNCIWVFLIIKVKSNCVLQAWN